jgi:ABC-type polysaccharide/polyol phosphate transport system ATPase subunit
MLNNENSIEVRNVSKSFKVYFDKGNELKEKMLFWKRNRYENRVVLNNISFTVKKGEAVGLIGRNGCGKSTTLKLLTKIIYPDSGSIEMCGRVSSLLELGAGFHPDMSGRENIYTNAAIFGLTKKEIDERLEDIIEFSELQQFIDNPVRTYSSGMYMRLAFSVAINVNADILLIDEILAVGDANFQAKCFNKLREIKANGTTIIIVSHALGQIEEICDKSIWIKDGQIEQEGDPREVDIAYLDYMNQERLSKDEQERARILREDLRRLRKRIKKVVTISVTEVSRQELMTLSCLVMTARGQKLLKQEEKP